MSCLGAPESRASGLDQALGTLTPTLTWGTWKERGSSRAGRTLGVSSGWAQEPPVICWSSATGTCSRPGQHGCEDRRDGQATVPGTFSPKRRQHVVHGLGSGPRVPEAP